MSADNWAICPKCEKMNNKKRQSLASQIKESYGQLSENEDLEMVEKFKTPTMLEETLREDYKIGIWNNEFCTSYFASCDKCGFEHSFNHKAKIKED